MVIYKITNKINGKIYIGQTINQINIRWNCHCSHNRNNTVIGKAIQKYGKENFIIEEIDGANSLSELNYLEQHYIHMYNSLVPNGYNVRFGGANTTPSEETRLKNSKSNKGRVFKEEHKKKLSEIRRKKYNTPDNYMKPNKSEKKERAQYEIIENEYSIICCKDCGQSKKRVLAGRYNNQKDTRWVDPETKKQFSGHVCPECHTKRVTQRKRLNRMNKQVSNG